MPCTVVIGNQRFRSPCYLHLQGEVKASWTSEMWYATTTLHGVTIQKISTWIFTAMEASKLVLSNFLSSIIPTRRRCKRTRYEQHQRHWHVKLSMQTSFKRTYKFYKNTDQFKVAGMRPTGIIHMHKSLNYMIIRLQLSLPSPYRMRHIKESRSHKIFPKLLVQHFLTITISV